MERWQGKNPLCSKESMWKNTKKFPSMFTSMCAMKLYSNITYRKCVQINWSKKMERSQVLTSNKSP